MSDQWTVRPTSENDRRIHFSGSEKDAREYVERNFPRPHIADPNSEAYPDVALRSPDGVTHHYVGEEWVDTSKKDTDAESEDVGIDIFKEKE